MKGNPKVIEKLNGLLAEELTAINQYMVHSEMCDNWGYGKLHKAIEKIAIDEMKHAEKLIGRILFLEGIPIVNKLNPLRIGKSVKELLANDLATESEAIPSYNEGIALAAEVKDAGTRELLQDILKDEEKHIDWMEAQRDQIEQMGLEQYLSMQVEK